MTIRYSPQVVIILGSTSDESAFNDSGATALLDACGILWELSIISAHRNPEILATYCKDARTCGVNVFIAGAGLSAALPGAIAAIIENTRLVFGVPLAGGEWEGMDALSAIQSLPSGTAVGTLPFGGRGFLNAAIMAVEALSIGDPALGIKLADVLRLQVGKKPAILGKRCSQ